VPWNDAPPGSGEAGFTLIETLTALTILGIALVSLFEAQATGLRGVTAASDSAGARILAQSLLADTLTGWNAAPVSRRGSDGEFNWAIDVAPERAAWSESASKNWRLFRVRVTVAWDRNRRIELDALKLGRVNE
jgi:general secretion pathway protein I